MYTPKNVLLKVISVCTNCPLLVSMLCGDSTESPSSHRRGGRPLQTSIFILPQYPRHALFLPPSLTCLGLRSALQEEFAFIYPEAAHFPLAQFTSPLSKSGQSACWRCATLCNHENPVWKDSVHLTMAPNEFKSPSPEDCPEKLEESKHLGDSANPGAQQCKQQAAHVLSRGSITKDRCTRLILQTWERCHGYSGSVSGEDKKQSSSTGQGPFPRILRAFCGNPLPRARNNT